MNLVPVVERLKVETDVFDEIEGAVAFAELADRLQVEKALFIIPVGETAGRNTLSVGSVRQPMRFTFGAVIGLQAHGVVTEADADALHPLRRAVREALIGWQHPDSDGIATATGGRLITIDPNRVLWWQDEFEIPWTYYDHV